MVTLILILTEKWKNSLNISVREEKGIYYHQT